MRNLFLVLLVLLTGFTSMAQQGDYIYHEVEQGETKYSISKEYNISIAELEKFNPDIKGGLKEKMVLLIPKKDSPKPKSTSSDQKFARHTVQAGETLFAISQKYEVEIEDIKKVNPELKSGLKAGQELLIPLLPKKPEQPKHTPPTGTFMEHKVEAGQTLYSLATKYGVPIPEIKKMNPSLKQEELQAGQIIYIPKEVEASNTPSTEDRNRLQQTAGTNISKNQQLSAEAEEDFTSGEYHVHKIEKGQTAYSISKLYHITLDSLYILNPGAEEGLRIGQLLKLPKNRAQYSQQKLVQNQPKEELATDANKDTEEAGTDADTTTGFFLYQVKTGDSFYSLKKRFNVNQNELLRLNPELSQGLTVDKYIIIPKNREEEVDVSWLDKVFKNVDSEQEPLGTPGDSKVNQKDALNRDTLLTGKEDKPRKEVLDDTLTIDPNRAYRIGVMLPFHAMTDTSFDYNNPVPQRSHYVLDFYNGLMMAADTLAKQGMNLMLNVYDTENSIFTLKEKVNEVESAHYDLLIGPLFQKNVEFMADQLAKEGTPVVSPLSKTVDVKGRPNLIKCVPDGLAGSEEIASIINANYPSGHVIFAHANTTEGREKVKQIKARLLPRDDGGFVESIIKVQDEMLSRSELDELMAEDQPNVVVVLSEDKVFLSDLISNLRGMRGKQVSVIGPPKLLQMPTLEIDYLNNLNLTMTDASFIDYSNPRTKEFIQLYREKYGNEPSQIAFQGYDVGLYFLQKLWNSGPFFLQTIGEREALLNTGFSLNKTEDGGYHNEFMHVIGIRNYTLVKISTEGNEKASAKAELIEE